MATVLFKPLVEVQGMDFVEAIRQRHVETLDVVLVVSLLEESLVDFCAFSAKVGPALSSTTASYNAHKTALSAMLADRSIGVEIAPILTMMTQDLEELRAVIIAAVEEDGRL